ncbi:MAG: hypothetical protein AB7I19_02480 [Planctomycetota bacterium]
MMYTVVRFTSDSVAPEELERVGRHLNTLVPGAFEGLRPHKDGFAPEIAIDGDWRDHRYAIIGFVLKGLAAIAAARKLGISVCVDVAIWPEDLVGLRLFCLHADAELLRTLAEADMSMEISIYRYPEAD